MVVAAYTSPVTIAVVATIEMNHFVKVCIREKLKIIIGVTGSKKS